MVSQFRFPMCSSLCCVAVLSLVSSLSAEDAPGVIRDADWKIEIRPSLRVAREASVPSGGEILTAAHQEAAPVPETVAAPEAATTESPAPKLVGPHEPEVAAPAPLAGPATLAQHMSYAEAYAAIPFSRTEYEANPGYRHQAALELMFGVLRPTTFVQNYTPRAFRYPDFYQIPYGRSDTQHINVRTFGGFNFNGQSPFGYPYGIRGNW